MQVECMLVLVTSAIHALFASDYGNMKNTFTSASSSLIAFGRMFSNGKVYLSCNAIVNLTHSSRKRKNSGYAVLFTNSVVRILLYLRYFGVASHSLKCSQIELELDALECCTSSSYRIVFSKVLASSPSPFSSLDLSSGGFLQ